MSSNQEILFTIGGIVFISIYIYVTYSASNRSGKSFTFLLLSRERYTYLSKSETVMQHIAVGLAIVIIFVTMVFDKP